MKKLLLTGLAICLMMVSCKREIPENESTAMTPSANPASMESKAAVPGVCKVYFSEEMTALIEESLAAGDGIVTKSSALNSLVDELGITSMRRLFPDAGEYEPRTRAEGLHRWYKITFDKDIPVTKAGEDLVALPGVEQFVKCYPIRRSDFPNDKYYNLLWGLKNSNGYDVNVEPVWAGFTVGNPDVVVCVVDGGIDLNHSDLAWNCASSGHYNYVYRSRSIDADEHGTHVAGTIAAVTNNGIGVAGIAGGDYASGRRGITLLSHEIFGPNDDWGDGVTAIKEGADHGAVISQNSWGYTFDINDNGRVDPEDLVEYKNAHENPDPDFTAAVDYFIKYAGCDNAGNQLPNSPMKGGMVLFAAGNDDIPYGPPAGYEPCVAVGAISRSGARAEFSCYGDWVDICAPGYDIVSTVPGSKYMYMSGTSMACPHISGVAALIVSYFGGPGYTAADLREALIGGAREIADTYGSKPVGPLVDVMGSLTYGDPAVDMTDFQVEAFGNSLDFTFTTNGNYGYTAFASTSRAAIENLNPAAPGSDVKKISIEISDPEELQGKEQVLTLKRLDFSTDYYVTVVGYAYGHRYGAAAPLKQITTGVNHPPVINIPSVLGPFHQYEEVKVPVEISDPDGNSFSVNYDSRGRARLMSVEGTWFFYLNGPQAEPGTYSMTVTVKDEYGLSSTVTCTYTLLKNQAPVVSSPFEVYTLPAAGSDGEVPLSAHFSDPDGEPLFYRIVAYSPDYFSAILLDGVLRIKALKNGYGTVTVSAMDALGESVETEVPILVRNPSSNLSLLPGTVVTNSLTVLPGLAPGPVSVRLLTTTGSVVYSVSGTYSVLDPIVIDLSRVAPGLYSLLVTQGGQTSKQTIVKK